MGYGPQAAYSPPVGWPIVGRPLQIPRTVRWLFTVTQADSDESSGTTVTCFYILGWSDTGCQGEFCGELSDDCERVLANGYHDGVTGPYDSQTGSSDPAATGAEEDARSTWLEIASNTQATMEATYAADKELFVNIEQADWDWPLLMSPPIDDFEFFGTDVLNIKILEGPFRPLSEDADEWQAGLERLRQFHGYFTGHTTYVFLDIGPMEETDPEGEYAEAYRQALSELPSACSSASDLGLVYGGEVDYRNPSEEDFTAIMRAHFLL